MRSTVRRVWVRPAPTPGWLLRSSRTRPSQRPATSGGQPPAYKYAINLCTVDWCTTGQGRGFVRQRKLFEINGAPNFEIVCLHKWFCFRFINNYISMIATMTKFINWNEYSMKGLWTHSNHIPQRERFVEITICRSTFDGKCFTVVAAGYIIEKEEKLIDLASLITALSSASTICRTNSAG